MVDLPFAFTFRTNDGKDLFTANKIFTDSNGVAVGWIMNGEIQMAGYTLEDAERLVEDGTWIIVEELKN